MANYARYEFPTEQLRNEFRELGSLYTGVHAEEKFSVALNRVMQVFSLRYGLPLSVWMDEQLTEQDVICMINEPTQKDDEPLRVYEMAGCHFVCDDHHILAGLHTVYDTVVIHGHRDFLADLGFRAETN